ncbi:MAG: N-acetylmuramoyl-L-alanine amidase [Flavobacteriaceae bacterium]|nr:N-acetylmuramoyl-L-alanine amidase [Flavobacteriaceae bacterium]
MNLQMFHKFNTKTKAIQVFVLSFLFILITLTSYAQEKTYTVVLDAGHGGSDPGKEGYRKYKEKDIALKITLAVGEILSKNEDINVIYTRKTDVFVDLYKRGKIANKADADLFVSIHCNAHSSQAYGAETWVLGLHANKQNFEVAKAENSVILKEDNYKENYKGFDPNSPESVIGLTLMQEEYLDQSLQLASLIQNNFTNKLKRKNRGVKQAGFIVLHQTYMPSILIETGFITNKTEANYLNSKNGQKNFAQSIASGIETYLKQLEINTVESIVIEEEKHQINKNIIFKVQIASGPTKLETKSYNFKGLIGVERIKVGRSYKYYYGKTSDYTEVLKHQKQVKKKGFTTAYITAFKNGEKISVQKALKTPQ